MRRLLFFSFFAFVFCSISVAQDFYWVGNGGNWKDFANHWATTSNGTTMHTRFPGPGDNVIFDTFSFSLDSQVVAIDTSAVFFASMNWTGVTNNPQFIGSVVDTLNISSTLILDNAMEFQFAGLVRFQTATPGQTMVVDMKNHTFKGKVFVDVPSGNCNFLSDLFIHQNSLRLLDGTLNLNNNNLRCRNFNVNNDSIPSGPMPVLLPRLTNVDTLFCGGSLHFDNNLNLSSFNGLIRLYNQFSDTSFVNFSNHTLQNNVLILGEKTYIMLSDLLTSGDIKMPFSGKFHTMNFHIQCSEFVSDEPLTRTLNFGQSHIATSVFILEKDGLLLTSNLANISFLGADTLIFATNKTDVVFNNISVTGMPYMFWTGNVTADSLFVAQGTKLLISENSTFQLNKLEANGSCGDYIEIRAICDQNLQEDDFCVGILPKFQSSNPITADYLKMSFIDAAGGPFVANNSYDEGGVQGWTVNEPTAVSVLFWVGNTGKWNDKNNWSSVSGGTTHTCIPSKKTHVIFDASSFAPGDTVSLDDIGYCLSMTWTGIPANTVFDGEGKLIAEGNVSLHSNLQAVFTGSFLHENIVATDTIHFITSGVVLNSDFKISGAAHRHFDDAFTLNNDFVFDSGSIDFNGNVISVEKFISIDANSRVLNLQNATLLLNGTGLVWDVEPVMLSMQTNNSIIEMMPSGIGSKIFNGGGLSYDTLVCRAEDSQILGSNSFAMIHLFSGSALNLESSTITTVDSLIAAGNCTQTVSILSDASSHPAVLNKTGFDSLSISGAFLRNVQADTSGGRHYEAQLSTWAGNVDGWFFPDTIQGKIFFWQGADTQWDNLLNWHVAGLPATCLPTIHDTVIVDPLVFSGSATDTMRISKNAYCDVFLATGINSRKLHMVFERNLFVVSSLVFDDSVAVSYSEKPQLFENEDEFNAGIVLIPENGNCYVNSAGIPFLVNLTANANSIADTVFLAAPLYMDTTATLKMMSGTFDASNNEIHTGYFIVEGQSNKIVHLENDTLRIFTKIELQQNALLDFHANGSVINLPGNSRNFSSFDGAGQTFGLVTFSSDFANPDNDMVFFCLSSNFFNAFVVLQGSNMIIEEATVQTVDSVLFVWGTCEQPVTLASSKDGNISSFFSNNIVPDTIYGVNMKDVRINKTSVAMLSVDNGNNGPNWHFDPTPAVTASFTMPYPVCIGDSVLFVNTSTSMFGNLDYKWIIKELVDSNTVDLNFAFQYEGDYEITLIATDTIRKCEDIFKDTLTITNHFVSMTTSVPGLTICQGNQVRFDFYCDNSNNFELMRNGAVWYSDTIAFFETNALAHGDAIVLNVTYNGCLKSTNPLVFTVHPLPNVLVNCSEPDTIICHGETITFTASGASHYEFFVNGVSAGGLSTNNIFSSSTLADSSIVTVYGVNDATSCNAMSSNTYMVRVLDNPVINLSAPSMPAEICHGDTLIVTASGGVQYEFFINGVSQAPPSVVDVFQAVGLVNGDIITALGFSITGCSSLSNQIEVIVNPSPNPSLVSSDVDNIICVGELVEFFGSGANEFQFFIDGASQGAFSFSNTFTTSGLTHGQTVSLEGRIGSCVKTAPQVLTFQVMPVLTLNSSQTTICQGENITFTATGDTVYQFFVDGVAAGPQGPSGVFATSSLTNGQIITVEGTNGACLPQGIEVFVNPLPVVAMSCSDPDTTICAGDFISFTASGAHQYQFFIDGASQGAPSLLNVFTTSALTNGQSVTVTGYTAAGCSSVSPNVYTVTVNNYPVVSLIVDNPATSLCAGDTFTFTASGAIEYEFFVSSVSQGVSTNNVFVASNLHNNATVSVYGITNSCAAQAPQTFTYTVYNIPTVSLQAITPISVCDGEIITVQASGATQYEFFVNGVSQGVPSVINQFSSSSLSDGDVISATGYQNICSNQSASNITVNINSVPVVIFATDMAPTGICYGDTALFTANGALSYLFYVDGLQYGGMNTSGMIQVPLIDNGSVVSVTGYNNACSSNADTVFTAFVHYVNTQLNTSSSSSAYCDNEMVELIASGADLYEFFLNGVSQGVPSSTNILNIGNIINGQFAVVYGTDNASTCVWPSDTIWFYVVEQPQITAVPGLQFCEGDSVTLISDVSSGNQWYLNAAQIPGAVQSQYLAYEGGVYSVTVSNGADGGVFSVGNNAFGQFGNGTIQPSLVPVQSVSSTEMKTISAGQGFVVALNENNLVYAWGNNEWGNLGVGTYSPSSNPLHVQSLTDISDVVAGYHHVLAIKHDSTLVSWGRNTSGQLGYGNFAASNFPMPVASVNQIIAVAAGETHSLALRSDGTVWAWGGNSYGQLGNGNIITQNSAVQVSGLDSVVFVAAGAFHSMAIRSDGSLWVWGNNQNGQLGLNNLTSSSVPVKNVFVKNIAFVDGGKEHSVAVNNKGRLFAWGSNTQNQLGLSAPSQSLTPVQNGMTGVEKVSCGFYNTFAIGTDGSVWGWGLNSSGQIADGTTSNVEVPFRINQLFHVNDVSAGYVFASFVTKSAQSCSSGQVTLVMDAAPPVTITQIGNTFTTIAGVSYQWYINGNPVPGATAQTINITAQGIYKVEVTFANGCSRMSDDYPYFVNVEEWFSEQNFSIMPNPNNGTFVLEMNLPAGILESVYAYSLWSVTGSVIVSKLPLEAAPSQTISFTSLAQGMYYLVLHTSSQEIRLKIIVAQ